MVAGLGTLIGDRLANGQVEPGIWVMVCMPVTPVNVTGAPNCARKLLQMLVVTGFGMGVSCVTRWVAINAPLLVLCWFCVFPEFLFCFCWGAMFLGNRRTSQILTGRAIPGVTSI